LQTTDGNLQISAITGGSAGCGSVLTLNVTGTLLATNSFTCKAGGSSPSRIIQATDGNIYGTAQEGGTYDFGTIFEITSTGITTLYSFGRHPSEGTRPASGLTEGRDGNFYGTTSSGGISGVGTLFEFSSAGAYSQIYEFPAPAGSASSDFAFAPYQHTNGDFYGVVENGGTGSVGEIYKLTQGLGPFVAFVGSQGGIGSQTQILGQGFTGTTSVTFNGVSAKFKVVSDTYLTATVPSGATTGLVVVTTPSGPLTSNVSFRISP
jgi:uncharacterized repeat protein (TIGR03803 family)